MPIERLQTPLLALALLLLPAHAMADDSIFPFQDSRYTGTLGFNYSNGSYDTARNTNVELTLPALSMETEGFKFTASIPYIRISGRGLVVFDASGNPIVINRRSSLAPDVRTGWGDLNLSASYTLPAGILDDFEVRVGGSAKLPTGSARQRLSTGEADYGVSIDVSRRYGAWGPFVTFGYLFAGRTQAFQLYDTASVSAGTTLELSDNLVALASYDFDSASTPLVEASHALLGSLTWIADDHVNLTGYTTVGLSSGSPGIGGGLLLSYGFN
jgi:hypothetical protein